MAGNVFPTLAKILSKRLVRVRLAFSKVSACRRFLADLVVFSKEKANKQTNKTGPDESEILGG